MNHECGNGQVWNWRGAISYRCANGCGRGRMDLVVDGYADGLMSQWMDGGGNG